LRKKNDTVDSDICPLGLQLDCEPKMMQAANIFGGFLAADAVNSLLQLLLLLLVGRGSIVNNTRYGRCCFG